MPTGNPLGDAAKISHCTVMPWQAPTWPIYQPGVYTTGSIDYANDVEVCRGEHDAVLRFFRRRGETRPLVKEITVPLALLDVLGGAS